MSPEKRTPNPNDLAAMRRGNTALLVGGTVSSREAADYTQQYNLGIASRHMPETAPEAGEQADQARPSVVKERLSRIKEAKTLGFDDPAIDRDEIETMRERFTTQDEADDILSAKTFIAHEYPYPDEMSTTEKIRIDNTRRKAAKLVGMDDEAYAQTSAAWQDWETSKTETTAAREARRNRNKIRRTALREKFNTVVDTFRVPEIDDTTTDEEVKKAKAEKIEEPKNPQMKLARKINAAGWDPSMLQVMRGEYHTRIQKIREAVEAQGLNPDELDFSDAEAKVMGSIVDPLIENNVDNELKGNAEGQSSFAQAKGKLYEKGLKKDLISVMKLDIDGYTDLVDATRLLELEGTEAEDTAEVNDPNRYTLRRLAANALTAMHLNREPKPEPEYEQLMLNFEVKPSQSEKTEGFLAKLKDAKESAVAYASSKLSLGMIRGKEAYGKAVEKHGRKKVLGTILGTIGVAVAAGSAYAMYKSGTFGGRGDSLVAATPTSPKPSTAELPSPTPNIAPQKPAGIDQATLSEIADKAFGGDKDKGTTTHVVTEALTPNTNHYSTPSDWAVERFGRNYMDDLHRLSDEARKAGHDVEWHGSGRRAWVEIDGKSDTKSVLAVISPFAK